MTKTTNEVAVITWIKSFKLGETRKIPKNVLFNDILSEGLRRWGYNFVWNRKEDKVTRVCPTCHR